VRNLLPCAVLTVLAAVDVLSAVDTALLTNDVLSAVDTALLTNDLLLFCTDVITGGADCTSRPLRSILKGAAAATAVKEY